MTSPNDRKAVATRVGARLRATRKAREMSQSDLASLLSVNAAEVSRHESGLRCPSVPALARYAEVLDVPIHELLNFDAPILAPG